MGLCVVLVPPSPKVQAQPVGLPVEASVKVTVWPATGLVGAKMKAAVGATGAAVTVTLCVTGLLAPTALLAMSVTV